MCYPNLQIQNSNSNSNQSEMNRILIKKKTLFDTPRVKPCKTANNIIYLAGHNMPGVAADQKCGTIYWTGVIFTAKCNICMRKYSSFHAFHVHLRTHIQRIPDESSDSDCER